MITCYSFYIRNTTKRGKQHNESTKTRKDNRKDYNLKTGEKYKDDEDWKAKRVYLNQT